MTSRHKDVKFSFLNNDNSNLDDSEQGLSESGSNLSAQPESSTRGTEAIRSTEPVELAIPAKTNRSTTLNQNGSHKKLNLKIVVEDEDAE